MTVATHWTLPRTQQAPLPSRNPPPLPSPPLHCGSNNATASQSNVLPLRPNATTVPTLGFIMMRVYTPDVGIVLPTITVVRGGVAQKLSQCSKPDIGNANLMSKITQAAITQQVKRNEGALSACNLCLNHHPPKRPATHPRHASHVQNFQNKFACWNNGTGTQCITNASQWLRAGNTGGASPFPNTNSAYLSSLFQPRADSSLLVVQFIPPRAPTGNTPVVWPNAMYQVGTRGSPGSGVHVPVTWACLRSLTASACAALSVPPGCGATGALLVNVQQHLCAAVPGDRQHRPRLWRRHLGLLEQHPGRAGQHWWHRHAGRQRPLQPAGDCPELVRPCRDVARNSRGEVRLIAPPSPTPTNCLLSRRRRRSQAAHLDLQPQHPGSAATAQHGARGRSRRAGRQSVQGPRCTWCSLPACAPIRYLVACDLPPPALRPVPPSPSLRPLAAVHGGFRSVRAECTARQRAHGGRCHPRQVLPSHHLVRQGAVCAGQNGGRRRQAVLCGCRCLRPDHYEHYCFSYCIHL